MAYSMPHHLRLVMTMYSFTSGSRLGPYGTWYYFTDRIYFVYINRSYTNKCYTKTITIICYLKEKMLIEKKIKRK